MLTRVHSCWASDSRNPSATTVSHDKQQTALCANFLPPTPRPSFPIFRISVDQIMQLPYLRHQATHWGGGGMEDPRDLLRKVRSLPIGERLPVLLLMAGGGNGWFFGSVALFFFSWVLYEKKYQYRLEKVSSTLFGGVGLLPLSPFVSFGLFLMLNAFVLCTPA